MKNKPTLIILAAGIGSRYGGLKQLDTFTPEGDTIMDFSIYDAIRSGFGKIVFVIRKSIEKEFKLIYTQKLKGKIDIEFVFQEVENIPEKYQNPNRTKPWGTGHAILMAKEVVKENFAVINADDFYGREAFETMGAYLKGIAIESYDFSMMAYQLKNTISEFGSVSRGECTVTKDGYLSEIIERTHIEKKGDLIYRMNEKEQIIPIDGDTIVSMNFWGFTPKCFDFGTSLFESFLAKNKDNLKAEFYIPIIAEKIIKSEKASIKVLTSDAQWFGVTYQEDKEMVVEEISKLQERGIFPLHLWK